MRRIALLALTFGFLIIPGEAADAPNLRVKLRVKTEGGYMEKLVSLLSKEVRHLEGVVIADEEPQFEVSCSVSTIESPKIGLIGYTASVAVTSPGNHLIVHFVEVDTSLESLAHEISLAVDGAVFERTRRADTSKSKAP